QRVTKSAPNDFGIHIGHYWFDRLPDVRRNHARLIHDDDNAPALVVQTSERLWAMFIPWQQVGSPSLRVRIVGGDQRRRSQIKEQAPTKKSEPLAQLGAIAGGKLGFVRGGEDAAAIRTGGHCPKHNPRNKRSLADTVSTCHGNADCFVQRQAIANSSSQHFTLPWLRLFAFQLWLIFPIKHRIDEKLWISSASNQLVRNRFQI